MEKKPVNVKLQMLFSVLPLLDLYASYRIQKLRYWILIFWVAGSIVGIGFDYAMFGEDYFDVDKEPELFPTEENGWTLIIFTVLFAIAQATVMRKWSKEWNLEVKN